MIDRFKNVLRRQPWMRRVRLARLRHLAFTRAHDDWPRLLGDDLPEWRAAVDAARGSGRRVLVATSLGGHFALNAVDRVLALGLTLRGADVRFLLCDAALPACQMCEYTFLPDTASFVKHGPQKDICGYCHEPARRADAALGLTVAGYGEFLDAATRQWAAEVARTVPADAISHFRVDDLPVGEHAEAGALRFFARGTLDGEPGGEGVLRRYFEASLLTVAALREQFRVWKPDVVVAHHGIYVPQGLVAAVAREQGVRVVAWNPAYRKHCFMFSHEDTYHHTMMTEPVGTWADEPLTPAQDALLGRYLESRWTGASDWISFQRPPDLSLTRDLDHLGLSGDKPLIVALTNVFWDAQLHYPANAFATQLEWLERTIEWFAGRPDLQLVVRIHPAEISGSPASRQLAADEIARRYPQLPANVRLVLPSSRVSTYDLCAHADCAIIYGTKTGVELTSVGIPVIVAGEAWIRNKGITHDATSADHYIRLLEGLPLGKRLDPDTVRRARAYAYHFFFRRMIPLRFIQPVNDFRRFLPRPDGLATLKPGGDAGLDAVCRGILDGTPFHAPASTVEELAE